MAVGARGIHKHPNRGNKVMHTCAQIGIAYMWMATIGKNQPRPNLILGLLLLLLIIKPCQIETVFASKRTDCCKIQRS